MKNSKISDSDKQNSLNKDSDSISDFLSILFSESGTFCERIISIRIDNTDFFVPLIAL